MLTIFHIKTLAWKSRGFEIISFNLMLKFFAVSRFIETVDLLLFTETVAAAQIYSKNGCT